MGVQSSTCLGRGGRGPSRGRCFPGFSPTVADGLGEEAQVLVDLQAVLQPQDLLLIVLEDGQGIAEHHLQVSTASALGTRGGAEKWQPAWGRSQHRLQRGGRDQGPQERTQLEIHRDGWMVLDLSLLGHTGPSLCLHKYKVTRSRVGDLGQVPSWDQTPALDSQSGLGINRGKGRWGPASGWGEG